MFFDFSESRTTQPNQEKLSGETTRRMLVQLKAPWKVADNGHLRVEFSFGSFDEAMLFVNDIAAIAEEENHHPDIAIRFTTVIIELSTHDVGGLTENDFILARKIEICC